MFFVLLLRRGPKWFTALECDECGGGGRRIGTGKRKGEGVIGDRLRLGFCRIWVRGTDSKEGQQKRSRREEKQKSCQRFYLLSTANNVMCRRAIVCKRTGRGVACPKLTCGVCATSC